ncbi:MAG: NAD(P)-dependent glycerol-3-phosphate dehydrogenase [Victivallaceae bacterium]|nr:NAD(P)-dependent glycerol-3-phosphate dehydrogenase [Victivallaceae bacterium]
MKITTLSDGSWGTALSMLLCQNGHKVTMWGPFPEYLDKMAACRENTQFLPGYKFHENLRLEKDMSAAVADSELILLASPAQYTRRVLEQFKKFFNAERHLLVNVAKGIENGSLLRVSEICADVLGKCSYAVLSGPSHAEEVIKGVPTTVVAASEDENAALKVQATFMKETFRVYTGSDVIGTELGGALKNVMAVAAGIVDGMQLGDNPKAALITRGIAEMSRLGEALGGNPLTFSGLSGIGDLIVTCCSGHSRNRHVGEELGRGKKLDEILTAMGMVVAEGVKTAQSAHALARQTGIECPIINEIYAVLYENKTPGEALKNLMSRPSRPEIDP